MNLKLKIKKYTELYYPLILSLVAVLISYFWLSTNVVFVKIASKILFESTLTLIISIEATMFGFLLAVLALILQMNNKLIQTIKEFGRFNDLISFCKKAIYSTFLVILTAFAILMINDITNLNEVKLVIYYFYEMFLIYSLLTTFRFVKVFFLLANSN